MMFQIVYNVVGGFVLSVVFHEIGHMIELHRYRIPYKGYFGIWNLGTDYEDHNMTRKQEVSMILNGILIGMIPILVLGVLSYWYWLIFPVYLLGVKTDIVMLKQIVKK